MIMFPSGYLSANLLRVEAMADCKSLATTLVRACVSVNAQM